MADSLVLETTFLVDLEREALRSEPGPAAAFLDAHPDAGLLVTWVTAGELASGSEPDGRPSWRRLLRRFGMLRPDEDTCWTYGRTWRYLRDNGLPIGANDLWIASAALQVELPLVTRDEAHFRRVPGLHVIGY